MAGFGEMAQRSRALAVPAEDQSSILRTHMQLSTASDCSPKGSAALFWPLWASGVHVINIQVQAKHPYV